MSSKSPIGSSLGANVQTHSTGSHSRKSIPRSEVDPIEVPPAKVTHWPKPLERPVPNIIGSLSPGDRFITIAWEEPKKPARKGMVLAQGFTDISEETTDRVAPYKRGEKWKPAEVTRGPRNLVPMTLVLWEDGRQTEVSPSLKVLSR